MTQNKGCSLHGVKRGIQAIAWGEAAAAPHRIGAMGGYHVTLTRRRVRVGSFPARFRMRGAKADDVKEFGFFAQPIVFVSVSVR
jgi:hypothetical protein